MSGDLKWNKIFGAGLGTAFVVLVVQQVSGAIYTTHAPEKPGYFVNAPEEAAAGAEAPALPADWGTVLPAADIAAGEAAFARCKACHNNVQGGPNGTGPNLYGVVGGPVMHKADFSYSDAMAKHKADVPTWTYDALDAFITAPARYVPGTKMSFAGLRDDTTRHNLIAYLRSQGSTGYAIPAPDPARQPGAAPAAGAAAVPAEGAPAATTPPAGAGAAAAGTTAPAAGAAGASTAQATNPAPPAATSAAPSNH